LPGFSDVRARSGAAFQHALGDQRLVCAAHDGLADAVLLTDLWAGGKTVTGCPHVFRDAPPEFVGDAEVADCSR
jgi:hypothetical protein